MLSQVHICPLSEVHLASNTITSVLDNTPFVSYLYSEHTPPPRIPLGKAERLSVYLYRVLATGLVLTVDDGESKCVGVAVWQGPNPRRGVLASVRDWFVKRGFDVWDELNSLYYGGGGLNHKRMADYEKVAKKIRSEILGEGNEEDTWYLHMLAVSPEYQGKGIGKKMVKYVTDISDRDCTRCYLITSIKEPNVAIYEKLGFKLVRTGQVSDEGVEVKFYCMLREPVLGS